MNKIVLLLLGFLLLNIWCFAQKDVELAKGKNFISTQVYLLAEDEELLKLYENLRVADVSDGMDKIGLPNTGLVDQSIHPAWVDYKDLKHIIRGIAVTARYVPTQKPNQPAAEESFSEWQGNFYSQYSSEAFKDVIRKGSVVVLDDVEYKDIGSIGSNNIMVWQELGAVGVITDASSRDVDEVAIQKIPLYLRKKGRGIRPGRNELESVNRPVDIGGVLVCPGDFVVADGDGVIVVPRKVAREVAEYAQGILKGDKEGRKQLYERLGLPIDKTIK